MRPPVIGAWGKLKRGDDGSVVAWHPLLAHCADVAACTEALLGLPLMRERFERLAGRSLSAVDLARLAVFALYHDLGKANWGFQNKQYLGQVGQRRETAGHTTELWAALVTDPARPGDRVWREQIWQAIALPVLASWGSAYAPLLAAAVSHHGRPSSPRDGQRTHVRLWHAQDGYDPTATLHMFGAAAPSWLPEAFADSLVLLPESPAFQHAFAGLVSLADWIGSDTTFFPYAQAPDGADFDSARRRAGNAVVALGLDVSGARSSVQVQAPSFADVYPHIPSPNAVQRTIMDAPAEPLVVILEAETGAGKTEAAFWHFRRLFAAGLVDSLYFALPTRVAATQIHARISDSAAKLFGAAASVVLAVPGYVQVDDVAGTRLPGFDVLWPDRPDDAVAHRRWAAENPKRFLAAPVAVGTIDQALQAALCVRHAHLRATSLLRSLLVVDEVHASDPYMHRLLRALLEAHKAGGGRALLMSATMGSAVRSDYLEQPVQEIEAAKAQPYPSLWGTGWKAPIAIDIAGRSKRVVMEVAPMWNQPTDVAAQALAAARAGARVLVVRNTVTAAIATQEALERAVGDDEHGLLFQIDGVLTLHHGRFAREDRRRLDAAVEAFIGKNRPEGGGVVVGTQTLEQSLDLDADLLITDLCPVDVLLQRIGRLHRHERAGRPAALRQPHCIVLAPADRDLSPLLQRPVNGIGPLRDANGVYPDVRVVEATWQLLEQHPRWEIPAMNRELVEGATHRHVLKEVADTKGRKWQEHAMSLSGRRMADQRFADDLTIDRSLAFGEQIFPDDEIALTRLGAADCLVDLAQALGDQPLGPFGTPVSRLSIPRHLCGSTGPESEPRDVQVDGRVIHFALGKGRFAYDRLGLRRVPGGQG